MTRLCQDPVVQANPTVALNRAADLLAQMADPTLAPADYLRLDAGFHVALAEASGNVVVAVIMSSLRAAIEGYVRRGLAGISEWTVEVARLQAEHAGVLRAVEKSDGAGAATLIRSHIQGFYDRARVG